MWSLPPETGDFITCGVPTVLFDATGSGNLILAHEGAQHVWVIGNDGAVLVNDTNSPNLGQAIYNGDCLPANVDGTPGEELVCFQAVVYATQPSPRQVYVLHYNASPPSLSLLWQNTTLADATASGAMDYEPGAVVDLDGNGTLEVVVSGLKAGVWSTYVLDAKTGATLATMPGIRNAGTAELRSDMKVNILTTDGQNLTAWTFDPTQSPAVTSTWTEASRSAVDGVDPRLLRTQRANLALATPDLNLDGIPDALTTTTPVSSALYDYAAATGVAQQVATYAFPAGSSAIGTWVIPATTEAYPQVATVSNDGLLNVFNKTLALDLSIQVGGFCAGGLHNSPLLSSLGATSSAQHIFVNDSRGALIRFDAQNASFAGPPVQAWSVNDCVSPSIIPALDVLNAGIVCHSHKPATVEIPSISALRGDGSQLWKANTSAQVTSDALSSAGADGGAPNILLQTVDSEGSASTLALAGDTGQQLWASTPVTLISGIMPFAVADWNGDGINDVLTILNSAEAISGANGQILMTGADFLAYGVPIIKDVNNDGSFEFTMQGAEYPARTLQHDLQSALWTGPGDQPIPTGAIVDCTSGPQLLEGNQLNPSRLYSTQVAGASAGSATFSVLAGGKQYPSEAAATADGAYLGQLSDLAVSADLTGTGNSSAVVGSTDGWVYAVDACSGTLQFSVPFGESVCGAVLGDTNGDGRDEIIVSTSGGYVYDVCNQDLPSPAPVLDTDPPLGITNKEVSTIVTQSTLYGAWQAVPGATSYEIAVSHPPEGIISSPPWQDAGSATSGSVTGLPLVAGQRYFFAARAVGPQGVSVDALSPGVTVIGGGSDGGFDAGTADAGVASTDGGGHGTGGLDAGDSGEVDGSAASASVSGGGCGCRLAPHPSGVPWLIAAGPFIVVARRRAMRACRPHRQRATRSLRNGS